MLSSMTSFTELAGCRFPLQLAGMGGPITDVALTCAVADAGGVGMLGAAGFPPEALGAMLDQCSSATIGPVGANFLMPFVDPDSVRAVSTPGRLVDFFYGDPDPELVALVHDGGATCGWQVGSLDEALAAVGAGCDYVVVQGAEAGGHVRGTSSLADVLAATVGAVEVPIVAAGGIGTADDVVRALEAGASAVRVGTRFVAALESSAHPEYVAALVQSGAGDTVLTETFSNGWPDAPHRVLRACVDAANAAADDVVGSEILMGAEFPVPRFGTRPPLVGTTGNIAAMAHYAGTSVGAVRTRQPAAEIVAELCARI
jgi:NAD(P)H-dependent flavin oxidoreductase YrpB (nitropropane dioxygenase family)